MASSYMVEPEEPRAADKKRKKKRDLYYDVNAEEHKGAFRLSVLFVFAGILALFVDLSNVAPAWTQYISLADVDDNGIWTYVSHVHLVMDRCELLFVELPSDADPPDGFAKDEPYIKMRVPLHDDITINTDVSGVLGQSSRKRFVTVTNVQKPAYAKYEGYFCAMEWHYPKGHRLPTTELELFGRHVSTVSGGRCERCELATMAGQPDGCVRPMPFEGNEEDGTCTAAPRWRPDARLMIRTAAGHKTPAIVQLKGVEVHNLTVDARAGGSASVNLEVVNPINVQAHQADDRVCATDVVMVKEEVAVVQNVTNVTTAGESGAGGTGVGSSGGGGDSTDLAALLAALLGGGGGAGGTTAAAAATTTAETTPAAEVIDESEVEDLGRRRAQLREELEQLLAASASQRADPARAAASTSEDLLRRLEETPQLLQENTTSSNITNATVVVNATNVTASTEVPLLDPSDLPFVNISAKGVISVRGQGTQPYQHHVSHSSYFNELYGVVISDSDLNRLKTVFTRTQPVADIVNVHLYGRGSPYGSWKWHRDSVYSGYSYGFMSAASLGLLSPRVTTIDFTLERAFCTLEDSDSQQATFGSISYGTEVALLKLHAVLARQVNSITSQVDDTRYGGLPSASTPIGFRAWGADRFGMVTVGVDHRVGVLYLAGLSYGIPDTKDPANLTYFLNFLVVGFFGIGGGLFIILSYVHWRNAHLQVWGSSYFGPKWDGKYRPRVREQAGFFFMVEFLVAYPSQRSGLRNRLLSVLVHFCSIVVPCCPTLLVLIVSRHSYEGPLVAFTVFGALLTLFNTIFGISYLALNYLGLPWTLRRFLRIPFHVTMSMNVVVGAMAIANVGWWLVVGASLRPSVVLPSAAGFCCIIAQIIVAVRRVHALAARLPSEASRATATTPAVNAAMEALEEGVQDWHRRRAVKDASETLGPMRVLELVGDAIRGVVHVELLWLALFVFLAGPIAIAHRTYGYHLNFAEAAVAALVIVSIEGALQLARPLADGGLDGQQRRWEETVTRSAAEEQAKIAMIEAEAARQMQLAEAISSSDTSDVDDFGSESDVDSGRYDDEPGRVGGGLHKRAADKQRQKHGRSSGGRSSGTRRRLTVVAPMR